MLLGALFHWLIGVTPPPNNVGTYGVRLVVRYVATFILLLNHLQALAIIGNMDLRWPPIVKGGWLHTASGGLLWLSFLVLW